MLKPLVGRLCDLLRGGGSVTCCFVDMNVENDFFLCFDFVLGRFKVRVGREDGKMSLTSGSPNPWPSFIWTTLSLLNQIMLWVRVGEEMTRIQV